MISKIKDIQETFDCDRNTAEEIKNLIENIADDQIDKREEDFDIPF